MGQPKTDPETGEEIIIPDVIRPALADIEPPLDEQEPRGADEIEDGSVAGRVIRPSGDA